MSDLTTLIPTFFSTPANNALQRHVTTLENHGLTTSDLLTLSLNELCFKTKLRPYEVKAIIAAAVNGLMSDYVSAPTTALDIAARQEFISTGNDELDGLLGGGIMTGSLTEIVGESGVGKTQVLFSLLLTIQLPPHERSSIYISTEVPLATTRLVEMMAHLSTANPGVKLSTDLVHTVTCQYLENLEHVIRYQLPVAIERYGVGLVVIDSIAANFRGEETAGSSRGKALAKRAGEMVKLGGCLQDLAVKYNLAVVVANQVADRFVKDNRWGNVGLLASSQVLASQQSNSDKESWARPSSSPNIDEILTFDYQQKWFTGWGDEVNEDKDECDAASVLSPKTPALGLVWTNLITARVALIKGQEEMDGKTKRWMKVVFCSWAEGGVSREYEIWEGGIRAVTIKVEEEDEYASN